MVVTKEQCDLIVATNPAFYRIDTVVDGVNVFSRPSVTLQALYQEQVKTIQIMLISLMDLNCAALRLSSNLTVVTSDFLR